MCGGKYFDLCLQSRAGPPDYASYYDSRYSGMLPIECLYINNYWWCLNRVGFYYLYPVFNPLGGDASRNPKYCSW